MTSPAGAAEADNVAGTLRALPSLESDGQRAMTFLLRSLSGTGREGLLDLRLLAFLADRWRGTGGDGELVFYLEEAGRTLYRRRPHGEERRLLGEAFDRLATAKVAVTELSAGSRGGHTRIHRTSSLIADLALHCDHPRVRRRAGAAYRVVLGPWLAEQLARGHLAPLSVKRIGPLTGLALRLALLLESTPGVDGQADVAVPIDQTLRQTLGLGFARPTDERKAIRRVAARLEGDARFASLDLRERGDGSWEIAAARSTPPPSQLMLGHAREGP